MKKIVKNVLLLLIVAFVIIQFIRPKKNISDPSTLATNDISKVYTVPDNVHQILQTSCYDCHSNNTTYPWYSKIQPVTWWLNNHIAEGKREINFSEFATYRIGRQYKKLDEIIKQVKEDEMPLFSYTIIHRNAILNADQKQTITNWATAIRDTIKANNPADSLIIKRPPSQAKS
jgi:hypothetical protein